MTKRSASAVIMGGMPVGRRPWVVSEELWELVGGLLRTRDADDNSAITSLTGFITECARSYWTPSSVDTYWIFRPQGGCLAVANSTISNYPDGNVVEKGAHAQWLRKTFRGDTSVTSGGVANRAIYTCTSGT